VAEDDQEVTDVEDTGPEATANPRSRLRLAVIFGLVAVVGLAAKADCMGTRIYQSYQGERAAQPLFFQVGHRESDQPHDNRLAAR
jgi:hypothetical protein